VEGGDTINSTYVRLLEWLAICIWFVVAFALGAAFVS
jgi:hypothetical protein